MKVPEQVSRLAVVFAILAGVVLVVRLVLIPRAYFSPALQREATLQRETAKPISFAGAQVCAGCHNEEAEKKSTGYHKGLACETCHGPAVKHAEDPENVKPYAPRDRKFCPVCHAYDPARPTGFPQINPTSHNARRACIACHNPHDPVPPEVPRECSACHAQIAHTKSLSAHANLECTTCHTVTEQHKITPRAALPTKPQTREFCGRCHSSEPTGADTTRIASEAPKVDLATHGGSYLCWQCHYPHLPEGQP